MKKLITLILLLIVNLSYAGLISNEINKKQLVKTDFQSFSLLKDLGSSINIKILEEVSDYTELGVDPVVQNILVKNKPNNIKIFVPEIQSNVLLYKFDISDEFNLLTSSNKQTKLNDIVHYRGIIENDNNSIVCLSLTSNDVIGVISNDDGNFVIGKIKESDRYIIYNDKDILIKRNFECKSILTNEKNNIVPNNQMVAGVKCVQWYYETDYDIFVNKGSVANVTSYIQGMFAQVATLYANDGMNIKLKTLFVWDTVDPYNATTTSSLLTQFGQYRTTFNGDLAHLCGYVGNGGIAFVNVLCSSNNANRMAYSDINPTYSLVPTYSWTIECVSHESGHNIASRHTHDCAWNGNNTPIDGCGPAAGYTTNCTAGPLPTGGGTIMSYCHLVSGIGINFNLGFGPQPTSLMQSTIASKTCLFVCDSTGGGGTGCTSAPSQPSSISGPTNPCSGTINTYSVVSDPNATSYTWQMVSGWSGTSTTNTISITAGTTSGNIAVFANNACGSSSPRTLFVTGQSVPATPGVITGSTGVCKNQQGVQYSIAPVTNATSYTWTVPIGSTITSGNGTTTILVNFGTRKGKVSVKANNSCGSSGTRTLNVNITCRQSNPIENINQIDIFPNPTDKVLNIKLNSNEKTKYNFNLLDVSGKLVFNSYDYFEEGINYKTIDVSELPSGVYILEIISDNIKQTKKVIVE